MVTCAAAAKTGPAVLAFHPAPFDYGQVPPGQRAARTLTLANTGGRASSALTVTLSGSAAFAITADTCRALDTTHIYWANHLGFSIDAAPLTGGTPTALVTGQPPPVGVAVGP